MANGERHFKKLAKCWADLSLLGKGLVVVSIPVAALVVASLLGARLARDKSEAQDSVKQIHELRGQLLNMYIVLSSAESAMRNYALTGKEDGIQPLALVGPSIDAVFDKINGLIQEILRTKTTAAWEAALDAAGVPCAPLQTIDQVVAHPQVARVDD